MADKLTPEELDGIYKTHEEDQKRLDADAENGLIVLPPWSAHPHRASLLRHVEALEQEVERLRATEKREARRSIGAVNIWKKQALSQREQRKSAERKLARLVEAVIGWREHDWPAWFCRRTAEAIADRVREIQATGEGK